MRRAGGIDSAFLALEMHDHPIHVMAVMTLDSTTVWVPKIASVTLTCGFALA